MEATQLRIRAIKPAEGYENECIKDLAYILEKMKVLLLSQQDGKILLVEWNPPSAEEDSTQNAEPTMNWTEERISIICAEFLVFFLF